MFWQASSFIKSFGEENENVHGFDIFFRQIKMDEWPSYETSDSTIYVYKSVIAFFLYINFNHERLQDRIKIQIGMKKS